MDGFLVYLGYYLLAGVLTRVVIYLLAEFGLIDYRFRTVGIVEHLIELFLTAILWPLFIVTLVIEFPGYLHSISPEGKAQAAQRAREEIEAKLARGCQKNGLKRCVLRRSYRKRFTKRTGQRGRLFAIK